MTNWQDDIETHDLSEAEKDAAAELIWAVEIQSIVTTGLKVQSFLTYVLIYPGWIRVKNVVVFDPGVRDFGKCISKSLA